MADVEIPLLSLNVEDSKLVRSRRWLKLGVAFLSASCLVLVSTSASRSNEAASAAFLGTSVASQGTLQLLSASAKVRRTPVQVQDEKTRKRANDNLATRALATKKVIKVEIPVDPIQEKIGVVCDALRNDEYDVDCRDMLLATAPIVLKNAKDKRHEWYDRLVGMMDEVFIGQDKRLQERLAEQQALVDGAGAQQATLQAQKENVESKLQANQVDLDMKRATQETNKALLKECEGKLKQATKERTSVKATLSNLVGDRERKEGVWESNKDQVMSKALKALLNELPIPKSLNLALSTVLQQTPASRTSFDNVTVAELHKIVDTHLSGLVQQIQEADKDVVANEAKMFAATKETELAKEQLRVSSEMVASAEKLRGSLELELQEAQKALKKHGPAVKSAGDGVKRHHMDLETLHNVMGQFMELRDRVEAPAVEASEALLKEASGKEIPSDNRARSPRRAVEAEMRSETTSTEVSAQPSKPALEAIGTAEQPEGKSMFEMYGLEENDARIRHVKVEDQQNFPENGKPGIVPAQPA